MREAAHDDWKSTGRAAIPPHAPTRAHRATSRGLSLAHYGRGFRGCQAVSRVNIGFLIVAGSCAKAEILAAKARLRPPSAGGREELFQSWNGPRGRRHIGALSARKMRGFCGFSRGRPRRQVRHARWGRSARAFPGETRSAFEEPAGCRDHVSWLPPRAPGPPPPRPARRSETDVRRAEISADRSMGRPAAAAAACLLSPIATTRSAERKS